MKKEFKLFVITKDLLTSPPVQTLLNLYNKHLLLRETSSVSFVIDTDESNIHIEYDPLSITIEQATIQNLQRQRIITLQVTPRDLGITTITFHYSSLKHYPIHSPRVAVTM